MVLMKDQINISTKQKESQKIDPHKYGQLIFDKEAKQLNGKRIAFSANDAETTGHLLAKKSLDVVLIPFTKINS